MLTKDSTHSHFRLGVKGIFPARGLAGFLGQECRYSICSHLHVIGPSRLPANAQTWMQGNAT